MARIFITGSADGLGYLAGKLLVSQGHQVVLHARCEQRARQTLEIIPAAEKILIADLSSIEETKTLAKDVNALGSFDAIIHNAGVYRESNRQIFTVNTLAPYILTFLIQKPERLIYLSSGLHFQGDPDLKNFTLDNCGVSYSDSKLHILILTMVVARKWPEVYANAVNPGWVPTKMGGSGARDDLQKGYETQAWLAVSNENRAKVSGRYFFHRKETRYLQVADNTDLQDEFLERCEQITGVRFSVDRAKDIKNT